MWILINIGRNWRNFRIKQYDNVFGIRRMLLIEFVIDLARVEWMESLNYEPNHWLLFIGCRPLSNGFFFLLNALLELTSQTGHLPFDFKSVRHSLETIRECYPTEMSTNLRDSWAFTKNKSHPKINRTERSFALLYSN